MTPKVQQLVASFENISTQDNHQAVAPTSSISVKAFLNIFEPKTKAQIDDETVQSRVTSRDGTNTTITGAEWFSVTRGDTTEQTVVQKQIMRFENMAHEGLVQDSETVDAKTSDCTAESDMAIDAHAPKVQQLVASFENISAQDNFPAEAPTSSISVKELLNIFEPTIKAQIDEEPIQSRVTSSDGPNSTITGFERSSVTGGDTNEQNGVLSHEGLVQDNSHTKLETPPSTLMEEREDGSRTVNPTNSLDQTDTEIEANADDTAQTENPYIFHVNVPASTPGHVGRSKRLPAKSIWRKVSRPKHLKLIASLTSSKKKSANTMDSTTLIDPIQDVSMNVKQMSADITPEKTSISLLETAPSKLEEEREDSSKTVNPTTSDCTDEGDRRIQANVDQTAKNEMPYIRHGKVPASTPGHSKRSKTVRAKTVWRKLSKLGGWINIASSVSSYKKKSAKTTDNPLPTVPAQVSIPIRFSAPFHVKSIEITLSVTSVTSK